MDFSSVHKRNLEIQKSFDFRVYAFFPHPAGLFPASQPFAVQLVGFPKSSAWTPVFLNLVSQKMNFNFAAESNQEA